MVIMFVFGKQHFVSKAGKDCYMVHYGIQNENVEGLAVNSGFINAEIYNKISVNGKYQIVYGSDFSGRAVINDLIPLSEK